MTQISRHANRISQDLTVCKPHEFTDGCVCVRGLLFPLHESEASRDQGSKSNYATVKGGVREEVDLLLAKKVSLVTSLTLPPSCWALLVEAWATSSRLSSIWTVYFSSGGK